MDAGLQIAPDKIQFKTPYCFWALNCFLTKYPKKIHLKIDHLKTLNDFQKLLGDINWLCPYLKLTTGELRALFDILKGDSDPFSKRSLNSPAREALSKVEAAISNQQITFMDYKQPWQFVICATTTHQSFTHWSSVAKRTPLLGAFTCCTCRGLGTLHYMGG